MLTASASLALPLHLRADEATASGVGLPDARGYGPDPSMVKIYRSGDVWPLTFTPEQRLFLGWGQIWCTNHTEQSLRLRTQTDPHSPGQWRVNGVVSNMPEFQKAFACKADAPMVRAKQCRVW